MNTLGKKINFHDFQPELESFREAVLCSGCKVGNKRFSFKWRAVTFMVALIAFLPAFPLASSVMFELIFPPAMSKLSGNKDNTPSCRCKFVVSLLMGNSIL